MKRKNALITGASRGIGHAAAMAFAQTGYDLILNCSQSIDALKEYATKLEQDYHIQVLCCCGDIADYNFVTRMFTEIENFCGGIDVLVNNAGISYIGLITDMSFDEWNRIIQTNLTSVFACCKCAIPHMISQKSGKIINISSDWGVYGASCEVAYSASKGGVNAFTKALAKELAPSNVQVNAIACGVIDTHMNSCFDELERQQLQDEIPAGYFASPKEVAEMILQLATSPSYLTGQIICFDGGWI